MRVYICAPYRAPSDAEIIENIEYAKKCGTAARVLGHRAKVPHDLSTRQFGMHADNDVVTRFDDDLLRECDEIWVCGDRITPGMEHEILLAVNLGINIKYYDRKNLVS